MEPTRFPRCLTPLIYGSALVTRYLAMPGLLRSLSAALRGGRRPQWITRPRSAAGAHRQEPPYILAGLRRIGYSWPGGRPAGTRGGRQVPISRRTRCSWTIADQVTSAIGRAPFTVTSVSRRA